MATTGVVKVKIPTMFRKLTGNESEVDLAPGTIGQLIDQLDERFPGFRDQIMNEAGELHRYVNVYVNDEDARYLEKLETKANEGDQVALLPSVAGG